MRVLAIAPEFTSMEGGAGVYVSELARGFPGHSELHIVASTRDATDDVLENKKLKWNVFVHEQKGSTESLLEDFRFKMNLAPNIRKMIRDLQAEIILTSSRMPDAFCSPRSIPIPIVTTVHSTIGSHLNVLTSSRQSNSTLSKQEKLLLAFGRPMILAENRYYKSARHFICVSDWGRRDLIASKGTDESRISTIPNGVDVNRFSPALKETGHHMFPEIAAIDSVKVLYVGRFTFAKGFLNLLKTIEMAADDPRLHFVIAGSGQHTIPRCLAEKCTFVGRVPHEKIPHLYAACDALILPSLYENMPLTVLEAMASGCVPVASRVGGVAEIIRHEKNGLLVPPGSPTAMVSAVQTLAQDRGKMRAMSRLARESIVDGFRIEKAIADTMNLLARVCAEGPQLIDAGTITRGDC